MFQNDNFDDPDFYCAWDREHGRVSLQGCILSIFAIFTNPLSRSAPHAIPEIFDLQFSARSLPSASPREDKKNWSLTARVRLPFKIYF
jgi:hypothetical protein